MFIFCDYLHTRIAHFLHLQLHFTYIMMRSNGICVGFEFLRENFLIFISKEISLIATVFINSLILFV